MTPSGEIMKARLITLLIIVFAAGSFARSEVYGLEKSAADVAVTDLRVDATNINKLLAKIAYMYDVPISLEVATDEDLLKSKSLKVQLKKGTLADVLDDIVKQKPSYRWKASDRTIKVFPKSDSRDPFLQTLLEIKIAHVIVRKSTVKLNFRETLTHSPELKILLGSYGVRPLNEGFSPPDFEPFGGDFSLDLENMSVRSILDSIIQTTKTKYWFIKRDEESREFFLINF
jgi:hypothetical protein